MSFFKIGWYIIYTKPSHEKKMIKDLDRIGIETYLPITKEKRKWTDRVKIIACPLFPSYVFVKLTTYMEFYHSTKAKGFVRYLKLGKNLARVKDSVIENIELALNEIDNFEVSSELFPQGKKVIIPKGTFSGLGCEIVSHRGKNKVLVRIDLLNRCLLVNLSKDMLSA